MASMLPSVVLSKSEVSAGQLQERHECLIEPMIVTDVGSPIQGIIEHVLVDRGEEVTAGQAIVALDAELEHIQLEQARLRATMEAEVAAREAEMTLARHNLQRLEKLHRDNSVSTQTRDEARAQQTVAKAALLQARKNIELLQIELRRAEKLLEQKTLRSPIDGVVVEQHNFIGEFVYDQPVMTIAQLDPLRIEVILPARLFGTIGVGDTARIYPEIDSQAPIEATVDVVDPLLDTRSGTFGVRLTLPNPHRSIAGGQQCELDFAMSTNVSELRE